MNALQSLFASAAILSAALCILIFPAMKNFLLLVPLALVALTFFSGCMNPVDRLIRSLPEGSSSSMKATVGGKFSHTTMTSEDFKNDDGLISAKLVHIKHSNLWVPNIELELVNWTREIKPAPRAARAQKAEARSQTPAPEIKLPPLPPAPEPFTPRGTATLGSS